MVLIGAIFLEIHDGQIRNRPVYVATGIIIGGVRDVLGLWPGCAAVRASKQWMSRLTELRNCGLAELCLVCCDGLKGRRRRSWWPGRWPRCNLAWRIT